MKYMRSLVLILTLLMSGQNFATEILLQGFNWESYRNNPSWYVHLENHVSEIADAKFSTVWVPPVSFAYDGEGMYPHSRGYMPIEYYNLNSAYGNEIQLRNMVSSLNARGIKPIVDVVLNHRMFSSKDDGGNFYFKNPDWGLWAFTGGEGMIGQGAPDTGEAINYAFDIDWTNSYLQDYFSDWLGWLKSNLGFAGYRFDFVKGFYGSYIAMMNKRTKPEFTVGEFWGSMDYSCNGLCYDQNNHRQQMVNWIDSTWKGQGLKPEQASAAFDFTTKGILQEAVRNREFWRLRDSNSNAPGLIGMWPDKAVTFIDNHDTGSTQIHWPFGNKQQVMQGYAYILTHPGIPCVFWDHYFNWGLKSDIKKLNKLRVNFKIGPKSKLFIDRAENNLYSAFIDDKIAIKLGPTSWSPSGSEWKLYHSGHDYAIWTR